VTLAFIINPHAGAVRRDPALPAQIARSVGARAEVWVTRDLASLDAAAAELASRNVRTVGILGGDGSASHVLTRLERAYGGHMPRIALIRGGTMNTVANALGISRRGPLTLARRACRAAAQNGSAEVVRRPALRVGDRLGFLFGTGVFHGFMAEYYARGHGHPTPVTAATTLARCVASSVVDGATYTRIVRSPPLAIAYDGGEWPRAHYLTVAAGTVDQAGLGFRPFARAMSAPDVFHLLAIHGRPTAVTRDLPSIWLGRGLRRETAHEASARQALLTSGGEPFGYSLDGDLAEAPGRLALSVGPTLEVLRI
jgi:diacylglycerol kinase (ATP)